MLHIHPCLPRPLARSMGASVAQLLAYASQQHLNEKMGADKVSRPHTAAPAPEPAPAPAPAVCVACRAHGCLQLQRCDGSCSRMAMPQRPAVQRLIKWEWPHRCPLGGAIPACLFSFRFLASHAGARHQRAVLRAAPSGHRRPDGAQRQAAQQPGPVVPQRRCLRGEAWDVVRGDAWLDMLYKSWLRHLLSRGQAAQLPCREPLPPVDPVRSRNASLPCQAVWHPWIGAAAARQLWSAYFRHCCLGPCHAPRPPCRCCQCLGHLCCLNPVPFPGLQLGILGVATNQNNATSWEYGVRGAWGSVGALCAWGPAQPPVCHPAAAASPQRRIPSMHDSCRLPPMRRALPCARCAAAAHAACRLRPAKWCLALQTCLRTPPAGRASTPCRCAGQRITCGEHTPAGERFGSAGALVQLPSRVRATSWPVGACGLQAARRPKRSGSFHFPCPLLQPRMPAELHPFLAPLCHSYSCLLSQYSPEPVEQDQCWLSAKPAGAPGSQCPSFPAPGYLGADAGVAGGRARSATELPSVLGPRWVQRCSSDAPCPASVHCSAQPGPCR